ncbi:MAG: T9SS type A sorting domain-containing protein [Bacteroidota bacterium]
MKTKYTYSLLLTLLLIPFSLLNAQNYFTKVIFSMSDWVQAKATIQTFDQSFYIAGTSNNGASIVKLDSVGTFKWSKTFTSSNHQNEFTTLVETADSCIILAGNIYNQTGGYFDLLCVKINSTGDTLWTKTYKLGFDGNALSIDKTNDNGVIITAYIANNDYSNYKMAVFKLDNNGNLQWSKNYTSGDWYNMGYSVKQAPDSGYYVLGYSESHPTTQNPPPPPDFKDNAFLLKLSPAGDFSWATCYALAYPDLHLRGMDFTLSSTELMLLFRGGANDNAYVLKVDTGGNMIWNKKINTSLYAYLNGFTQPYKFLKTNDDYYSFSSQYALVKMDSSGIIICSKDMGWFGYDVQSIPTIDNGFFMISNGPLIGAKIPPTFNQQIGTAKTDSAGWNNSICNYPSSHSSIEDTMMVFSTNFNTTAGNTADTIIPLVSSLNLLTIDGCVAFSGAVHENNNDASITIYPNPTAGSFNLITNQIKSIESIEIYDVYGKLIYQTQKSVNIIDISSQPNGVYFLRLTADNKQYTQKLVLSK